MHILFTGENFKAQDLRAHAILKHFEAILKEGL